jgi:hypothetical protein
MRVEKHKSETETLDPGSGEARPVLSLSKGRDDEMGGFRRDDEIRKLSPDDE